MVRRWWVMRVERSEAKRRERAGLSFAAFRGEGEGTDWRAPGGEIRRRKAGGWGKEVDGRNGSKWDQSLPPTVYGSGSRRSAPCQTIFGGKCFT